MAYYFRNHDIEAIDAVDVLSVCCKERCPLLEYSRFDHKQFERAQNLVGTTPGFILGHSNYHDYWGGLVNCEVIKPRFTAYIAFSPSRLQVQFYGLSISLIENLIDILKPKCCLDNLAQPYPIDKLLHGSSI